MLPSAKPTLLIVTSTLPRWSGDTEPRFILDLCDSLADRYRVHVLAPHARGAARRETWGRVEVRRYRYFAEWGEVLAYDGGILPKLARKPWLWLLVPCLLAALVITLTRLLLRERFDVVHAHWIVPQGVAVRLAKFLAGSRVPIVCTAHGSDILGLRSAPARALQRWAAAGCFRVGAVSSALRDELLRRGVPAAKLRLLPMGVALAAPAQARDANLVACAGRVVAGKGVDVVLAAFARLAPAFPSVRLVIAGGGPDLARYQEEAAAHGLAGRVDFLGAVPQARVLELFARAAIAVVPSFSEGLGLVMLEAMAAGCPTVVTDLPAIRDVVRPGENALVFPAGDSRALADALARMLEDRPLAEQLGREGRRDVEGRYAWSAVAEQHALVYAEATGAS